MDINKGDNVTAHWKKVYPKFTGVVEQIKGDKAQVRTEVGLIDFPLTALKKRK